MKAVFLDRDGVINEYPGDFLYVKSCEEFKLLPGVAPALKKLIDAGYRLYVISNQAGVSKGVYSQDTLDRITDKMISQLKAGGVELSGVYYCTHLPDAGCSCRKPRTGLLEQAFLAMEKEGLVLEREKSYFIGDSVRDIQTGKGMGLKTIMVFSGREKPENRREWKELPDHVAGDLAAAVELILK